MAPLQTSLRSTYQESGKAWTGSGVSLYQNPPAGYNLSLNTLQQALPPCVVGGDTSSNAFFDMLVEANCGNLSGTPAGTGFWPLPYVATLKNISLISMSELWIDNLYFDLPPHVNYKFVPTGYPYDTSANIHKGNYADCVNRNLFLAGSLAPLRGSNYPSVNNATGPWSPGVVPQSASAALRLINSASMAPASSESPFTGTITLQGVSSQYCYADNEDGGGRKVSMGGTALTSSQTPSSFKVPWGNLKSTSNTQNTTFHAIWLRPRKSNTQTQTIYNTCWQTTSPDIATPGGITLSILGSVYPGAIMVRGHLAIGNNSSNHARTMYSVVSGSTWYGINELAWNLVCFRMSSHLDFASGSCNEIYIWKESTAGNQDWQWYSGSAIYPPTNGNADPIEYNDTGRLMYSPRAFQVLYPSSNNGYEYYSGSIGHHYIFEEGGTNVAKPNIPSQSMLFQVQHDAMNMLKNVTNSGSYYLYGVF